MTELTFEEANELEIIISKLEKMCDRQNKVCGRCPFDRRYLEEPCLYKLACEELENFHRLKEAELYD